MAEVKALSLDDPIVSVMIGGQPIIITLANILEVAKLKNELGKAQERAADQDIELTAANERLSLYWTKILEGKAIIDDLRRQLNEEKEITKRLMTGLEREIGWRGKIGVKHYLQGKFVQKVGLEFVEIVGDLTSCLKKKTLEMEGVGGGVREGIELGILRDIPIVLKSLKEKIERANENERENIIKVLGVMKGIIKLIGWNLESLVDAGGVNEKESGEQGRSSAAEDSTTGVLKETQSNEEEDEMAGFETYIEVVEDEEEGGGTSNWNQVEFEVPQTTSGGDDDASGQIGKEGRETTPGDGASDPDQNGGQVPETTSCGDDASELPVKIAKRKKKKTTSKVTPRKIATSCSTATGTPPQLVNKHVAHPANKRMCICGFTTHVTNINKHIWRLTEGRSTTRGPHVCPKCGDRFKAKSALRKHLSAHTNGVPKKKQGSARPTAIGTGDRPTANGAEAQPNAAGARPTCIICARPFPNKKALYNHRRRAHGPKKVVLKAKEKVVKKATETAQQQKHHLHQVDMGKAKTGHFCKCGNRYFTQSALIVHIRKFTQQLQFKCPICEQRFLWNSLLVQHLERGHKFVVPKAGKEGEGQGTGVRFVVSCSFCGGKFTKYDELHKHRKAVHGIGKKCT